MISYRSLLFVPGSRADRFDKAVASGADTIVIDLEDAVLPAHKAEAREASLGWLIDRGEGVRAGLRINSPRTADGCADLATLAGSDAKPDFVMVPKAETAIDIEIVSECLGSVPIIAMMESGRALASVHAIAAASSAGVLFGGADYSAGLLADLSDWDAMLTARGMISAACGAASVPAYDVPHLDVQDQDDLYATTKRAKAFGFSGRACIHPSQVETVNSVFSPTEADIAEATAIVESLTNSADGAVLHKGKLIDRPIVLAAQRTLARARS